jgi:hypothetical protein
MSQANRRRFWRTIASVAALLGIGLACVWAATGFRSGVLFAIGIGAASAVAIFSDSRRVCSRASVRRR